MNCRSSSEDQYSARLETSWRVSLLVTLRARDTRLWSSRKCILRTARTLWWLPEFYSIAMIRVIDGLQQKAVPTSRTFPQIRVLLNFTSNKMRVKTTWWISIMTNNSWHDNWGTCSRLLRAPDELVWLQLVVFVRNADLSEPRYQRHRRVVRPHQICKHPPWPYGSTYNDWLLPT